MTEREILVAARAKIEKPENWTQGELARDKAGDATFCTSPDAYAWCMLGSLRAVGEEWCTSGAQKRIGMDHSSAYLTLCAHSGTGGLAFFNDTHAHADVLAAYDAAIAAAGEVP